MIFQIFVARCALLLKNHQKTWQKNMKKQTSFHLAFKIPLSIIARLHFPTLNHGHGIALNHKIHFHFLLLVLSPAIKMKFRTWSILTKQNEPLTFTKITIENNCQGNAWNPQNDILKRRLLLLDPVELTF